MPYCTHCGHQNPDGSNYCARCGEAMQTIESAKSGGADTSGADTQVNTFESTQVIRAVTDETRHSLSDEEERAVNALPPGSALLILHPGSPRSERFLIAADLTTVGRHPATDIFLDDITVSRKHAVFSRNGGQVTVEDQGSLNGTYVNRSVIEAPTELHDGDEVMIGKFRLTFFAARPSSSSGGSNCT